MVMTEQTIGARLRELRRRRRLSQEQLEARTGISQTRISDIERGRVDKVSVEVAQVLARALDAEVRDLLGMDEPSAFTLYSAAPGAGPLRELGVAISVRVPVLRTPVRAGVGGDVPESDVIGWEYVDAELAGRRLFALVVRGSCLEPDVLPGDRVVYEEHAAYEPGQLVVAVHDGEPLVKFAVKTPDGWELWSHHERALKVNGETVVYGPVLRVVRQPARWRGGG